MDERYLYFNVFMTDKQTKTILYRYFASSRIWYHENDSNWRSKAGECFRFSSKAFAFAKGYDCPLS